MNYGKTLKEIGSWLVPVGALNWGLHELGFNLVEMIPVIMDYSNVVYLAIGAFGAYEILTKKLKVL